MKKKIIQKLRNLGSLLGFGTLNSEVSIIKKILIEEYLENRLRNDYRYNVAGKLNRYEYQVMSQNGEDGIIHEIFNRIGTKSRYFVEFGTGDGTENNTASLLLEKWNGFWIEGKPEYVTQIRTEYQKIIDFGQLVVEQSFITSENIVGLFKQAGVPDEFDLLSIDIDGNDFWVWQALSRYKPRVVVIEYNASLGPSINWVQSYNPIHIWNGKVGNYFGASLKAIEILGNELGYSLIGCNLTGVNAFFVRKELVLPGVFCEPFISENHYEKPMYFLEKRLGHKRNHKVISNAGFPS